MQPIRTVKSGSTLSSHTFKGKFVELPGQGRLREEAENFIKLQFHEQHNARVAYFLKRMIGSYNDSGLATVVGFESAKNRSLYLEQYLSLPIEKYIHTHCGVSCQRERIMEVGNLASTSHSSLQMLILALTDYFYEQDIEWVVFTAAPVLMNTFRKFGIQLLTLAEAKADSLAQDQNAWGSYYENNPQVLVGHVPSTARQIQTHPLLSRLTQRVQLNEFPHLGDQAYVNAQ